MSEDEAAEAGYSDYKQFPNGRNAAIMRLMFTHAIVSDLTRYSYEDRWCFASYEKAQAALAAWDGEEDAEPQGWHRHPDSGRRRPDGDASKEYVAL
jgi:hypothetical protein